MTDENRRRSLAQELQRASEAFRAGEALLSLDLNADAVSRAYYARSREFADYDAAVAFSADDARAELEAARSFEAAALELLRAQGWIEANDAVGSPGATSSSS